MKPYSRECMFTQALQNICGGYYKALAGFLKAGRIPQPLAEFDLEQIRYEHRFAPFADLTTPPAIGYNDFCAQKYALLASSKEDLFALAARHFQQARAILEAIPNLDPEVCQSCSFNKFRFFKFLLNTLQMTEVLKVVKINLIVTNLLANGHKKDSTLSPEFDFSSHRCFPIIKQL